jgi:hypothetical protein
MSASQIIQELSRKPLDVIEADLQRITTERRRLQDEENFLRAVRELVKREQEDQPPAAASPTTPPASAVSKADPGQQPSDDGGRKRVIVRDVILDAMRPRGFEPWPIPRIIEAVQERKPDAQAPAIRLALRRLYAEDILIKDQHRNYRLNPERNGLSTGTLALQLGEQAPGP